VSNPAYDAGATRPVSPRRSFALGVACVATLLAIVAVWLLGRIGGSFVTRAFTDIVETLVALGAAILCWRASRARSGRDRLGWMLLGGAALSWGAGQVVWSYIELVQRAHPFPSPADLFSVVSFAFSVAGLLAFGASPSGLAERLRAVLDGLITWSSVFFLGWGLVLGAAYHAGAQSLVSILVSMAYPAFDLVLVAVAVSVARRARSPGPFAFIAAGILCMAASDSFSAYEALRHASSSAGLVDLGWVAGFLLVSLGSLWRDGESEAAAGHGRLRGFLPYAALPPAMTIVAVRTAQGQAMDPVLAWMGLFLMVLVLSRQMLALHDNRMLARRIERKYEARTADLARSEERFRTLVQNSSDVVLLLDEDLKIGYTTGSSSPILGRAPGDLAGLSFADLLDPTERDRVEAALRETVAHSGVSAKLEHRLRRSGGGWSQSETIVSNLLDTPGIGALVLTVRDVTQRKGLEDQLRELAFHDPLTGLPNRTLFQERLGESLERWRSMGEPCAVMLLDLDNFKYVNDSLGHAVGDELLKQVAERITLAVRAEDTVARAGGDEFTLLLGGLADAEAALEAGARLMKALTATLWVHGREVTPKASIGIALAGSHGISADELLRNADVAMYRAKAQGRGRCELFDPALHAAALQRLEREVELRNAIGRPGSPQGAFGSNAPQGALGSGELVLHYQPLMDLANDRMVGVEALVRWQHPRLGLLQPGDFITLAEETGLIVPVGEWVLNEACRQVALWQQDGTAPGLKASVNLSSRQLYETDLPACVAAALANSGLDPTTLVLEITESLLLDDGEETMQRLLNLRELGVQLAMDDFGTGYSSLSYLSRLPIQILKIDRAFVSVLGRSDEDAAVVRAILSLARTFGMEVVAEGIERPEEVAALKELGCPMGQGFYFSRPLDAEALASRIAAGLAAGRVGGPATPRLSLTQLGAA
jgi:diguanylate cyclase (GGDEF)-like protein/PAS domain S-box-containing protein